MALTTVPAYTNPPDFPSLSDKPAGTYNSKAYAWAQAMPTLGTSVKAIGDATYTNAQHAETQATAASGSATNAGNSATAAAASALAASNTVATIPVGTIDDGVTSLVKVWSSIKVNTYLSGKQATLVSGTSIKTLNGTSLLGSGNIDITSNLTYEARTSNTIFAAADKAKIIHYTTGSFTQTFTAAATLGAGWFIYLQNTSTTNVTLDPNASETIDGVTSGVIKPGMTLLVTCTGTAFQAVRVGPAVAMEVLTSGTSWTCPIGVRVVKAAAVGGGGGANTGTNAPGAGGGTSIGVVYPIPGTAYTYAIGAAGVASLGGDTSFTVGGVSLLAGGGTLAQGGTASGGSLNVAGPPTEGAANFPGGASLYGFGGAYGRDATGYGGAAHSIGGVRYAATAGVIILEY